MTFGLPLSLFFPVPELPCLFLVWGDPLLGYSLMGECWQHAPDCTFVNVGESKTKELWQLSWSALRHLAGVIAERPGYYQEV